MNEDMRQKRTWLIQGFDGVEQLLQERISSALSEKEAGALLQRLAARHLLPAEIIGASLRRGMKGYNTLLAINREPRERVILSVGANPHYIASLHTEYELQELDVS